MIEEWGSHRLGSVQNVSKQVLSVLYWRGRDLLNPALSLLLCFLAQSLI